MKAKNMICVVGAPVKTVAEVIFVILSVVFGGIIIFISCWLFGNYYGRYFHVSFPFLNYVFIGMIGVMILGVVIKLCMAFYRRTEKNYYRCKKYWNGEE